MPTLNGSQNEFLGRQGGLGLEIALTHLCSKSSFEVLVFVTAPRLSPTCGKVVRGEKNTHKHKGIFRNGLTERLLRMLCAHAPEVLWDPGFDFVVPITRTLTTVTFSTPVDPAAF